MHLPKNRLWAAGLLLLASLASPLAADTSNSCVECHRVLTGVTYLEHDFADWQHSVHAKAGVTCEDCHGGNPTGKDLAGAHAGLKPSTDPSSPVYFTRIPATCGKCHQAEYKAFQKSAHYKELMRSGRGPTCISCHGSMANHILAPRDLDESCTLCHQKPMQASATMLALNHAGASLARLETALSAAKSKHVEAKAQESVYQELKTLHQKAVEDWHTFNMGQVLQTSQQITKRANNAVNELELKSQQEKR